MKCIKKLSLTSDLSGMHEHAHGRNCPYQVIDHLKVIRQLKTNSILFYHPKH